METFTHLSQASRVVFGDGTVARLREEAQRLGATRVLVVCTSGRMPLAERAAEVLGDLYVATFAGAREHTPVDVTERALEVLTDARADAVVAIGGGSTTGLSKALALRTDVPQVIVPTTYAGSEATPVVGETAEGRKTTTTSPRIQPETIVYDIDLTMDLPLAVTLTSAVNAMAHSAEALYAPERSPVIRLLAMESIQSLSSGLSVVHERRHDRGAREALLYGAWLAGTCLAGSAMGLHHKLAHVLGGTYGLPHAPLHTVLLPYVLAYNASAAPAAVDDAAAALGGKGSAAGQVRRLVESFAGPVSLGGLGLQHEDVQGAVVEALSRPYPNPRDVTADELRDLLERALVGAPLPG